MHNSPEPAIALLETGGVFRCAVAWTDFEGDWPEPPNPSAATIHAASVWARLRSRRIGDIS